MKKTFTVSDFLASEELAGVANEYRLKDFLSTTEKAKTLFPFTDNVKILVNYHENEKYLEDCKILVNDSFVFSYHGYQKFWSFYTVKICTSKAKKAFEVAPKKESYNFPSVLKVWNQKKFDEVIRYLQDCNKAIEQENNEYSQNYIIKKQSFENLVLHPKVIYKDFDENDLRQIVYTDFFKIEIYKNGNVYFEEHGTGKYKYHNDEKKNEALLNALLNFEDFIETFATK
jgi:hypothetical protein